MFVTVTLSEGRMEMFNLNCRIVNFIHCLKDKCSLDPQGSVDLLDKTGELMNLSERENSMQPLSTLLKDRQCYILICVSRIEGHEGFHYSTVQDGDLGNNNLELAEILRKLSNPSKKYNKKGLPRKGSISQTKSKTGSTPMKTIVSATGTSKKPTQEDAAQQQDGHTS